MAVSTISLRALENPLFGSSSMTKNPNQCGLSLKQLKTVGLFCRSSIDLSQPHLLPFAACCPITTRWAEQL